MPDRYDFLRRLAAQAGNEDAVARLRDALQTPSGQQAAQAVSARHAADLERAAQAAQRGDMATAAQLVQQLMRTPEGARLAAQFKQIFRP